MNKKFIILLLSYLVSINFCLSQTNKPVLHGKHWIAITGKPLGATSGAMIFSKGGNAIDAACAMVASTATMWDVLGWGGETQALIYHPKLKKVTIIAKHPCGKHNDSCYELVQTVILLIWIHIRFPFGYHEYQELLEKKL